MDYKEWQQKVNSGNGPTNEDISTIAGFITNTGLFRSSGTLNQNGHHELSAQTDQFIKDVNFVYTARGNEPETEQNWNDSYQRIDRYLNTTLKEGDNFKHLMEAGSSEGNTLFANDGANFFKSLETINRSFGVNTDIGWYKTKHNELKPELAANAGSNELDEDFVIEGGNPEIVNNNGIDANQQGHQADDDFTIEYGEPDLDENLNINEIRAEHDKAHDERHNMTLDEWVNFSRPFAGGTPAKSGRYFLKDAFGAYSFIERKLTFKNGKADKELINNTKEFGKAAENLYNSTRRTKTDFFNENYDTAYNYLNNYLPEGDNLNNLIEANKGAESFSPEKLFLSLNRINRDFRLGADIDGLVEKYAQKDPASAQNIRNALKLENEKSDEAEAIARKEWEEKNRELIERKERYVGSGTSNEDSKTDTEEKNAALLAQKKNEEAKKQEELRKQEQALKDETKRLAKEAAEKEKQKKKEEAEAKRQRELKRRERPYEVKDNKKYEKSENAYLRNMFEDEEKELKAKHKNLAGFKSSGEHSDLVSAYDEFIKSLDTKSENYSRERKAKCKMALKDAANEYMRMKRERARLNGDHTVDDPNWEPKSKMGKRRYRSAMAIVEKLERFETDYDRLVVFEDDLTAKRTRFSSSSDDHADLAHSFKALKGYLKYENKNANPELKKKLMDDLRKDAERYLKKIAGPHLNDPNWYPTTEMGRRRFAAAKAVIVRLNQMEGKTNKKRANTLNTSKPAQNQLNNLKPPQGNNSNSNSDKPNQQPLNNDDMRLDIPEEMKLSQDDYTIRRSNSITPKSKKLDKFKEEHQRMLEKEAEKFETPFDRLDPAEYQTSRKPSGKKAKERNDGTVEYNGQILPLISKENLEKKSLLTELTQSLSALFTQACALMLASGGFLKKKISVDELDKTSDDLKNNKEFTDKVNSMTKEQLVEGIKNPSKAFRNINNEIQNEKYDKMLEENKQQSLLTNNDITSQQNLFLNTVAVKHAKAVGDHSPDAVDKALNTIQNNDGFMHDYNMMTPNELKEGIMEPDKAYKAYTENTVKDRNVVKDSDIANTRSQYEYRAKNDFDGFDRISAKSCCNAVDSLNNLIGSDKELTKEQQRKAKGYIATLVFDEFMKNDKDNTLHQQFVSGKLKYMDAVKKMANSPEMKGAFPEKIDKDYLKNFLAGKNGISPKHVRAKLEQNRQRNRAFEGLETVAPQRRRATSITKAPTHTRPNL